mgnify:CR=1 FL=1
MRIDILTVVPELLASPLNESILKRAQEKGLVEIHIHNIRDYTEDKHRTTDDYPFGGEAGMVMKIEPIYRCIEALKAEREYDEVIYTSPDGIRYDQHEANRLSTLDNLIILCGHYKGIDHRIREHLITRELSIGDYVLTGGELAACVIADSVVRILPGAIGDEASALTDCFQDDLLAPPVYTRPAEFRGWRVPDVLLSGNFAEIDRWHDQQAGPQLLDAWKDLSIRFEGGLQVEQVERVGPRYRVTTTSGRRFAADEVVVAAGLVPPQRLAQSAGLDWAQGIAVDADTLQTSVPRIHALGDVDELNSHIGLLLCEPLPDEVRTLLVEVQHQLFNLGGELSIPGFELLKAEAVLALDDALAHHNAALPRLQEFILPAGTRAASQAHICRTVARRAERAVVALGNEEALNDAPRQYLNRLSDLMFVLARVLNRMDGGDDVYWKSERLAQQNATE